MTERLLNEPFWVIDVLPEQVPAENAARYFAVEKHFLRPSAMEELHRRFTDLLLKLNCYYDFQVFLPDADQPVISPAPELLASWIGTEQKDLCVLLPGEDALITLNHDDIYMTVWHPSEALLKRIGCLASADGLFLRQPEPAEPEGGKAVNGQADPEFRTVAGLSHAAIRTRSLADSIRYYTEVLGLREAFRMYGEDGSLSTVYLFLAPGQYLELFARGAREGIRGADVIGVCHLCLMTKDVRRSYEAVRQAGGPLDSEIRRGKSRCLMFWTHDPDGTQIEVMEMPPESMQAQADTRFEAEDR